MAKARKLTISRSERHHVEEDGVELQEDDVWSMVDDIVNSHHSFINDWTSAGGAAAASAGGLSVAFEDPSQRIVHQSRNRNPNGNGSDSLASPRGRHVATSAPVNVPDWSKIYRVLHDSDDGIEDHESDMVPPHEYLARSHRSAAKSVFEGVGRTLKGRDMSRVRDAVWSQTGFDG